MYAPPDIIIPLTVSVVFLCVVERFVHAITVILTEKADKARQNASSQLVLSVLDGFLQTFAAAVLTLSSLLTGLISSFFWVFALIILGAVVYVTYEQAPWVWTDMIRSYNAVMGPFWHDTIFKLLDIFNVVFKAWIPLWNSVVFFFYQITQGYLLPVIIRETAIMINLGNSIFSLGQTFSYSSFVWIRQLIVECPPRAELRSRGHALL